MVEMRNYSQEPLVSVGMSPGEWTRLGPGVWVRQHGTCVAGQCPGASWPSAKSSGENLSPLLVAWRNAKAICTKESMAALQEGGSPSRTSVAGQFISHGVTLSISSVHTELGGINGRAFNFLKTLYDNAEQLYIANAFEI